MKIRRIDLPDTKLAISLQYLLSQTGFGSLCKDPILLRKVLVYSQFLKSRTGSNYVGKTKLGYVNHEYIHCNCEYQPETCNNAKLWIQTWLCFIDCSSPIKFQDCRALLLNRAREQSTGTTIGHVTMVNIKHEYRNIDREMGHCCCVNVRARSARTLMPHNVPLRGQYSDSNIAYSWQVI